MDLDVWAILSLLRTPGVGPASVHRILATSALIEIPLPEMIQMPPRALLERLPAGLHDIASPLSECREQHQAAARALIERVEGGGGRVLVSTSRAWPRGLRALASAMPPLLFVRGRLDLIRRAGAAVVGSREPSAEGLALARASGQFFAAEGAGVISGGARGIDSAAHSAVLEAGGWTIVVLPQGLLTYIPPSHIASAVDEGRALVVSQFSPDAAWETHGAVTRNATISALARMVCVVDPRKTGGSIRAARIAIGQRKPVAAWCSNAMAGRLLETAGAGALADGGGNLRKEYLRELWCQSLQQAPVQPDLFQPRT